MTMVLAEKIVTALDRGEANTRWRDFADIHVLIQSHEIDADELRSSLVAVANFRDVILKPLRPHLESMPERAQPRWVAWRNRANWDHDLPPLFADVLNSVACFADPVLEKASSSRWNPRTGSWHPS